MQLDKYIGIEKCNRRTARKIQLWVIGLTVLVLILIIYFPLEYLFHYLGYKDSNGCPLLTLTGIPCPMCGMGRSFLALITLNFTEVFYYNPAGAFVYLVSGLIILAIFILSLFNYRIKLTSSLLKLWYIPVIILIVIWVLNIMYGYHSNSF